MQTYEEYKIVDFIYQQLRKNTLDPLSKCDLIRFGFDKTQPEEIRAALDKWVVDHPETTIIDKWDYDVGIRFQVIDGVLDSQHYDYLKSHPHVVEVLQKHYNYMVDGNVDTLIESIKDEIRDVKDYLTVPR